MPYFNIIHFFIVDCINCSIIYSYIMKVYTRELLQIYMELGKVGFSSKPKFY